MRWLLYALGGGLGHITRAIALARCAVAHDHRVTLLVNSPFAGKLPLERELPGAEILALNPALDRDAVARRVVEIITDSEYQVVVIDTFPRGLGGELAEILPQTPAIKVLVHRLICSEYVAAASLRQFVAVYDRILVPGETAPLEDHPRALRTAPWLIRDRDELCDRDAARRTLGVTGDRPLVLVTGCGSRNEVDEANEMARAVESAVADRATVLFSTPGVAGGYWPLLPLLPAVDILVGSGGYNTVYETRVTSTQLVAIPRRRLYDRQHLRLHPDEMAATKQEAIERVVASLDEIAEYPPASYANGVHAAVAEIEQLGGDLTDNPG